MGFSTRAAREQAAAKAVEHTRKKLYVGASNTGNETFLTVKRVTEARLFLVGGTGGPINTAKLFQVAAGALQSQAGNCGEQAAVAFKYLFDLGVFPLDYISSTRHDHAWVVIGRPSGADIRRPEEWGDDWVVCDPWIVDNGETGVLTDTETYDDEYDAYYVVGQVRVDSRPAVGGVVKSAESPI